MMLSKRKSKTISFTLPAGELAGIKTAEIIKKLAHHWKKRPMVRYFTVSVVKELQSHDSFGEIQRVFYWVRDNIRYVKDIRGCETLQMPPVTLPYWASDRGVGAGDCDDHVLLLASMLLSIGVKDLTMRIVKYSPDDVQFRHIYLVVKFQGKEYGMDAIAKNKDFGWEVKHYSQKDISL